MRRVDYHVDRTLILQIEYLRGRLMPQRAAEPPSFDDPRSFNIEMDTASITLTTGALADLLNRYVFNYPGTPLRRLELAVEKGRLKQKGRLHGMHFSLESDVAVTSSGELRLHPTSIHVLGIGVKGMMKLFGLSLHKLADVRGAPGVRIDGNDLLLTPAVMLPPPATRGTLVAVRLNDSSVTLRFGRHKAAAPLLIPGPPSGGYMYFRGGTLRFWSLTMKPADLLVVDHDPRDPFDFWLAEYKKQLMAGFSKNTATGGLMTEWPDYRKAGTAVMREPQGR
jgi:hypothetical protein